MLDNYITAQETVITAKLDKIAELESAIAQLRKEIRLDEQLKQARVTASKELAQWLAKGKELLGDMAGIFPLEFLEDVKSEVATITDEIKDNFHSYCDNGDRFLSASGEDITEPENYPEPITAINSENNDSAIELENSDNEGAETIEVEVIEGNKESEIEPDNIDNDGTETALNASELAKRLGFKSHHEVTSKFKSLNKNAFIVWSINHDPDKYGWYKVDGKYQIVA